MNPERVERDAGEFGSWLSAFRGSLHDGEPVEVPCDGCTSCCRSGKVIPVAPDETDALASIPVGDLAPMPGDPSRQVLRHDDAGRCSQLTSDGCSIYAHRPQACRLYDCRIFAAAGLHPDSPLIAERVQQWRFSYAAPSAREQHSNVRRAAVALGFPGGLSSPVSPTQHAVEAIESAGEFAG